MSLMPYIICPRCGCLNYISAKMCQCGMHLTQERSGPSDRPETKMLDRAVSILSETSVVSCPNCGEKNYAFPKSEKAVICRSCYVNMENFCKAKEQEEQKASLKGEFSKSVDEPTIMPDVASVLEPTPMPSSKKIKKEKRIPKLKMTIPGTITLTSIENSDFVSIEPASHSERMRMVSIGRIGTFGKFFQQNTTIGREHCTLEYTESLGWIVRNTEGVGGINRATYLNGKGPLPAGKPTPLKNGDVLRIGYTKYVDFKVRIAK